MPINPSIPLSAVSQQRPLDIMSPVMQGMQLRALQASQQAREMELEEATRQRTQKAALRDVTGRHAQAGTMGSEQYLADVAGISPEYYVQQKQASLKMLKASQDLKKSLADLKKAELDLQTSRLDQSDEMNEYLLQRIGSVRDQASYDTAKATVRSRFAELELDTGLVDSLPEIYDPTTVNDLRLQALSVKEQLAEARQGIDFKKREQEALMPGRVAEAKATEEATRPGRMAVAAAQQERGLTRQAEMVRQKPALEAQARAEMPINRAYRQGGEYQNMFDSRTGQKVRPSTSVQEFEAMESRGEAVYLSTDERKAFQSAQRSATPLKRIGELLEEVYTTGAFRNLSVEDKSDFEAVMSRVGAGTTALMNQFTQKHPELTRVTRLMKANIDLIRRGLQGQVGTQTEGDAQRGLGALPVLTGLPDSREIAFATYNDLVAIVNDIGRVFMGNEAFQFEGIAPLETVTAGQTITEEDIQATMQSSGRTRQEVIDAARAKGYIFEGQ